MITQSNKRERRNGWTAARRERFLASLVLKPDVRRACRAVGLSRQSAYRLRGRDAAFAAAWDQALCRAHEAAAEAFMLRLPDFLLRTLSGLSGPCHLKPAQPSR